MSNEPELVGKPDQEVQEAIRHDTLQDQADDETQGHADVPEEDPGPENRSEGLGDDDLGEERHSLSVETAFVVFVQDGEAMGIGSIGEVSVKFEGQTVYLEPQRQATIPDMWRASVEVAKDIEVHETAQKTVEAMQAHTLQMQAALQRQRQQEAPGGGRLHIPGA